MEHEYYFKYYIDQNNYISKNYKIHSLLYIIDIILTYLTAVDGIGKKYDNSEEEQLYSLPNLFAKFLYSHLSNFLLFSILIGFIIINIMIYLIYDYIFIQNNILKFYINYYEIFHIRFLTLYYFTIMAKFKGSYLFFGIIIMIIFICMI